MNYTWNQTQRGDYNLVLGEEGGKVEIQCLASRELGRWRSVTMAVFRLGPVVANVALSDWATSLIEAQEVAISLIGLVRRMMRHLRGTPIRL